MINVEVFKKAAITEPEDLKILNHMEHKFAAMVRKKFNTTTTTTGDAKISKTSLSSSSSSRL